MKNILTIMKKELARFFGDRRMVVSLLLPGIAIYLMYSVMGSALTDQFSVSEDFKPTVYAVNTPTSIGGVLSAVCNMQTVGEDELEAVKARLTNEEGELLVVFPANFDEAIQTRADVPNVEMFYVSTSTDSSIAYDIVYGILDAYETEMTNIFDINNAEQKYDLASDNAATGMIFSMMMPMLLMMFLFSGCMAVAPEAIAGEKERGTIATLLITPVKRSEIALGKVFALCILALLSGVSSTIGTLASLPKLMNAPDMNIGADAYSASDYVLLAGVILSTVLLLISLISILSAYAKTIKEAQMTVMPLMLVVMFLGVSSMLGSGGAGPLYTAFIPLYNSVSCMTQIFGFNVNTTFLLISVVSNVVYTALGVFALTKMFNSEKIMFRS